MAYPLAEFIHQDTGAFFAGALLSAARPADDIPHSYCWGSTNLYTLQLEQCNSKQTVVNG
jgi:hypothetical protein